MRWAETIEPSIRGTQTEGWGGLRVPHGTVPFSATSLPAMPVVRVPDTGKRGPSSCRLKCKPRICELPRPSDWSYGTLGVPRGDIL